MPQKRKFFAEKPEASQSLRRLRPCFCANGRKKFAKEEKTADAGLVSTNHAVWWQIRQPKWEAR